MSYGPRRSQTSCLILQVQPSTSSRPRPASSVVEKQAKTRGKQTSKRRSRKSNMSISNRLRIITRPQHHVHFRGVHEASGPQISNRNGPSEPSPTLPHTQTHTPQPPPPPLLCPPGALHPTTLHTRVFGCAFRLRARTSLPTPSETRSILGAWLHNHPPPRPTTTTNVGAPSGFSARARI